MTETAPARDRNPLRRRRTANFRLFLASQVASHGGTWLQFVALAWLASELTGSGAALGWIAVATFGPLLVLAPWAGALADRVDKRRLLIVVQLMMAAQALVLGALVLAELDNLISIYCLAFAYGVIHAIEAPVRRAIVAELVGQEHIPRAVSLTNVVAAVGRVVGPLGAGALIATAGIGWCFVANAVSYLIALTALLWIDRAALLVAEAESTPGAVRAGLRYAWRVPRLRIALTLTAVVATFGFNHQVVIPLLAARVFDGGVGGYTMLYTALSAGSVVGALLVMRRRHIELRLLTRAVIAFAVANGCLAVSPNLVLAAGASFAAGAGALLFVTAAAALLQQSCAPAMRGRVMALFAMVLLGGIPLGAPIVGAIADVAGPRAAVAMGSVAAVAAGLCTLRPAGGATAAAQRRIVAMMPAR
ncbi:MAG: MFS transporter [Actinomycetia bacterium]|nr:MFS transporter [Actinomycetes bacterium]